MSYVYARGDIYWIRTKDPISKKWISDATPHRVSDPHGKRKATRVAEALQRKRDASTAGTASIGPLTVRAYAEGAWIDERRAADLDWLADRSRLKHHILPTLGNRAIADVRAPEIVKLVRDLRFPTDATKKLAQRTIYNIYSVCTALFRDAKLAGYIEQSPCDLTKRQLGPVTDKDPKWRSGAVFTRDEAETLISDERIPFDRRLYYAFEILAGMRPGEIAALRWSDYDATAEPLGRLTVALALNTRKGTIKGTKTGAVREVPVHPALAAMLAEWRLSGWQAMRCRQPEPGDLLLPLPLRGEKARRSRKGEPIRTGDYAGKRWREEDLVMLGWRDRQMYDGKSTFITLCGVDGAEREVIKSITHTKSKRDAFDGYDRASMWPRQCREIVKLKIARKRVGPKLVAIK